MQAVAILERFFWNSGFLSILKALKPYLDLCLYSGGLRLKRDVAEFTEFVRSFKAPAVDEKFELLGT